MRNDSNLAVQWKPYWFKWKNKPSVKMYSGRIDIEGNIIFLDQGTHILHHQVQPGPLSHRSARVTETWFYTIYITGQLLAISNWRKLTQGDTEHSPWLSSALFPFWYQRTSTPKCCNDNFISVWCAGTCTLLTCVVFLSFVKLCFSRQCIVCGQQAAVTYRFPSDHRVKHRRAGSVALVTTREHPVL